MKIEKLAPRLAASALAFGLALPAFAQDQVVTQPGASTPIVPAPAAEVSPVPTPGEVAMAPEWASRFPTLDQQQNNEQIAELLVAQGFSDITILREGSLMTITATREGEPLELVYNMIEARLIYINGERILTEEEQSPAQGSSDAAAAAADDASDNAAEDDASDDAGEDEASDSDEASDDASDDSSDDSAS
ncbi:MAG: hypothetical protein Q4G36_01385 [Paracoccus sp. (in: a-proteobacteria)]|nr:hypothetical protein [Paracoccus sp. (in: a-proteobacteria)]